jgi:phage regulator Rha-like protein
MNDLVFIDPAKIGAVPFTTSDVIAEFAKIKHHAVQQMISKHETSLKAFGQVAFEMRAVKYARGTNQEKIYRLTEEQATLLITFLKNTEPVIRFKTELVRQFYLMRTELYKRELRIADRKPVRLSLTDAINEDPDHGKWDYKTFTDLIYKVVTGMNAAQLRKERGAKKDDTASDYMTAAEIEAVTKMEGQVAVLKQLGMDYCQIKALLVNRQALGKLA